MLEKNIKLLARLLHNPDLLLRQSVQPGPRRSARPWLRSGVAALCAREACRLGGAVYARRASGTRRAMRCAIFISVCPQTSQDL